MSFQNTLTFALCINGLYLLRWLCEVSSVGICSCCGFRRGIVRILICVSVQIPQRRGGFSFSLISLVKKSIRLGMFSWKSKKYLKALFFTHMYWNCVANNPSSFRQFKSCLCLYKFSPCISICYPFLYISTATSCFVWFLCPGSTSCYL